MTVHTTNRHNNSVCLYFFRFLDRIAHHNRAQSKIRIHLSRAATVPPGAGQRQRNFKGLEGVAGQAH